MDDTDKIAIARMIREGIAQDREARATDEAFPPGPSLRTLSNTHRGKLGVLVGTLIGYLTTYGPAILQLLRGCAPAATPTP